MDKGYSYVNKHSIIYEWEIKEVTSFIKFSQHTIDGPTRIESPTFSTGSRNNDQWQLFLSIKDEAVIDKKIHMCTYLISRSEIKPKAYYRVFILDKNKEKYDFSFSAVNHPYEKHLFGCLISEEEWCWYEDYLDGGFFSIGYLLKKKDEFLPNDTLTIFVDLTVYDDHVALSNPKIPLKVKAKDQMIEDFKKLFITKKNYDIFLEIGGRSFKAHKSILMARSSVFYAMVSHKMDEKIITKPEILQKILEFIYTCEIENLDDDAQELLEAANKYALDGLKEICEYSISNTLTIKNAVSILVLADCSNAQLLMDFPKKFIIGNFVKIKNTEEFEALEKSHPSLYFALLKEYAMKN